MAMKYIPFAVVLVALIPSPTYAQNTQFSDCRTLEAAGNNIGSDEALVNGMVCKAAKVKANSSVSTKASGKTAETEKRMALLGIIEPETLRSKVKANAIPPEVVRTPAPASARTAGTESRVALLGIIEPETLRSKSKAEATAAGDVATPRTDTAPEPETEPGANVTPQSARFEMQHNAGLGDIARAYQKNSQAQAAAAREDIVEPKKLPTEVKLTAAPTAPAPETATTTLLQPGQKTNALTAAQAPASLLAPEKTPAAITPASVTPIGPQPAAKTEVFAAPQAPVPTVKAETNLPTVMATPVITPEPPSDGKTEVFASAGALKPEASPVAAPAAEEVVASEPQKSVKLGLFVEPQTSSPEIDRPPEVVSYLSAQEDGFNDGQRAGCTKNVSLGSLDKEKLFLAIPEWAANWYEKNQKRFPGMCFSDSPMPGAQNYLVVFYTSAPAVSEIDPLKNISASADMSPLSGVGTFTTSYGSTWHYTYDRSATTTVTTVLTEKVPHNLQSNVVYAAAYSEQGTPISQHWPTAITKKGKETSGKPGKNRDASLPAIHVMGELLDKMAEDIAKH
ncbi:MAG: hypothetical protein DMG50_12530 [Acidobacteria bacterium]|nr:MAG: hypothetical protein DMG50_12530 [Acidobacteriota bacterium]